MFVFSGRLSIDGVKGISCRKSRLFLFGQFNHLKSLFALLLKENNISCTSRRLAGLRKARIYEVPKFLILVFYLLLAAH
jgi:hypothetical protein